LTLVLGLLAGCNGTTGTLVTLPESVASGGMSGAPDAGGLGSTAYRPAPGTQWQIQLSGTVDTSVDVALYEVDLFDTGASVLADLHAQGRAVACYVSVGTDEQWRSDSAEFPAGAIGAAVAGYAQENWLDIRDPTARSVIAARLVLASDRGCDAVELSNLQAYQEDSGFPLTLSDELEYARLLINQGHSLGLSLGISSSDELVAQLSSQVEWGLVQSCLASQSCAAWQPFIAAGKAVFMVEFATEADAPLLCPQAKALGFSLAIKHANLDAFRVGCSD
jgi:hypothetical protein